MEVKELTLDNGLKLVGEINPDNQSAAIGFFVRAGARDETPKEAGISHFLEHMLFKGSSKFSALELSEALGEIGAQSNAYTADQATVYYSAVIPEYFPRIQEILSDMMRPTIDPDEFAMEKEVILEEIALYQDRPGFHLFERSMEIYYQGHPAGNSVLGTRETVSGIDHQMMRNYFDRRYSPSNMVLVAAGKFDWDKFVEDAKEYCGQWKNIEVERELRPYEFKKKDQVIHKKDLNQAHLLFVSPGPTLLEEERYPLGVLAAILGDSTGSKLYWELVETGIAEAVSSDTDEREDTGVFNVYTVLDPERVDQATEIIQKVMSQPMEFTEGDLERAKTKISSKLVFSGESPMGRLGGLGLSWLYRQEINSLREIIGKVAAVTRDDIEAALQKYSLSEWSEYRLMPE